jgi:hypothetical protein
MHPVTTNEMGLEIAINESKLYNSINDGEIHIPVYVSIRKDRTRHGGGMLIYIKEYLPYSNRSDLVPYRLEMICLEIKLPYNRSFLVWLRGIDHQVLVLIYLMTMKTLLRNAIMSKQLIISDDMNCDYSKINSEAHTQKLQFISSTYQLEQLILEPTRVTNTSATQIDLIFTNDTRNVAGSGVAHIGLSDHSLIYVVRRFMHNPYAQTN